MSQAIFHLGTFRQGTSTLCGLVVDGHAVDVNVASDQTTRKLKSTSCLGEILDDWDRNFDCLIDIAANIRKRDVLSFGVPMETLKPLPPLGRPGKQLYSAANYREHVSGMRKTFTPNIPLASADSAKEPEAPYMFGKVCAQTGALDDIWLPDGMSRIDWEAELMVVIGRSGMNIPEEQVDRHIAGYMTTNDVSCRDRTWRLDRPAIRSDWLSGKSFETFAPTGPYFTPKAFVPDHADMNIRCWVNGVLKQDGNSRDMIFDIESQVAYASRLMRLTAGDVIATGTPAGTGQERLEFLSVGDVLETEVQYCGRQRNNVVAGPTTYMGDKRGITANG